MLKGAQSRARVLPAGSEGFPRQPGSSPQPPSLSAFHPLISLIAFGNHSGVCLWEVLSRAVPRGWLLWAPHKRCSPPQSPTSAHKVGGSHLPRGNHLPMWKKRKVKAQGHPRAIVPCRPLASPGGGTQEPHPDTRGTQEPHPDTLGLSLLSLCSGWPGWARWEPSTSRS